MPTPPDSTLPYATPADQDTSPSRLRVSLLCFIFGLPIAAIGLGLLFTIPSPTPFDYQLCILILSLGAALSTLATILQLRASRALSRTRYLKQLQQLRSH